MTRSAIGFTRQDVSTVGARLVMGLSFLLVMFIFSLERHLFAVVIFITIILINYLKYH